MARVSLSDSLGMFLDRARGARFQGRDLQVQLHRALRMTQGAPEVVVKVYGGEASVGQSAGHLDYLMLREDERGRDFELPAENQDGQMLTHAAARAELADWRLTHRPAASAEHDGRRTLHLTLSMPANTDLDGLKDAVRDWAADVFGKDGRPNHAYMIVFHDRHSRRDHHKGGEHPHAHVIVDRAGYDLTMLEHRAGDLHEWRVRFAEALEDQGIRASATPWISRNPSRNPLPGVAIRAAAAELDAAQDPAGRALAAKLRQHEEAVRGRAQQVAEQQRPARSR